LALLTKTVTKLKKSPPGEPGGLFAKLPYLSALAGAVDQKFWL
jgi:hypothetical protein